MVSRRSCQFRVGPAHHLDGTLSETAQEGRLHAGRSAEAGGAADDAPQHVATALVAGHDPVGDEEGHGPGVVGQDPQGHVDLVLVAEARAGDLLPQLDQRLEECRSRRPNPRPA